MPRKTSLLIPVPVPASQEGFLQPVKENFNIKNIHSTLKRKLSQEHLHNQAANHLTAARILVQQRKLQRAKKQSSLALLAYYRLPEHNESLHLELKSLLKSIERGELQPHWDFHHVSHALLRLKRERKENSRESLESLEEFKKTLAAHADIALPLIRKQLLQRGY